MLKDKKEFICHEYDKKEVMLNISEIKTNNNPGVDNSSQINE